MKQQQSITSLPPSPEAERRSRMIKYTVAMSIRVACIFAMLFVDGWWLAVCAAGAIFLPYVAVVLANVSGPTRSTEVLRPGGLAIEQATGSAEQAGGAGEQFAGADERPAGASEQPAGADDQQPPTTDEQQPQNERGAA